MITKIDYKILDIVSQYPISINDILFGKAVNLYRTSHLFKYYSEYTVSYSLYHLLLENFIFYDGFIIDEFSDFGRFVDKKFSANCYIELTQKGGQYWEEIYQPNWHNYIGVCYDDVSYTQPVNIELTSMNFDLLQKIYQELNQEKIIIEKLTEWEICYWKKITDGDIFQFSYAANSIDEKILVDDIYHDLSSYKELFCKKTRCFL